MSKYNRPPFFTSPYSNISPPATSFHMARSISHDSATSVCVSSAYASLAISQPLSRSSSNTSSHAAHLAAPTSAPSMRRTSSTSSTSSNSQSWLASPYRSCLTTSYESHPTSYLSDDDLLALHIPVERIAPPTPKREISTEEQIARLREMQDQEEREERARRDQQRRKQVRFQPGPQDKSRRPSQLKRRSTAVRKGLSSLNGPQ